MVASQSQIRVVLAEDDEDHVLLLQRALRRYTRPIDVTVARDGQAALDALRAATVLPGLLLLDINMPKLTGLEVLVAVKADPALQRIPTVMLTTSGRDEDRRASLEGGADDYVTKPVNYRDFQRTLAALLDRYFAGSGESRPEGAPP